MSNGTPNIPLPQVETPTPGFNIRPLGELWFEESLPASLYQYFTGNTKKKQAEEAKEKLKQLDPDSEEFKEQLRIYNKFSYLLAEPGSFDVKEVAKFVASNPSFLAGEMVNAVLADPYLLFIPFIGWGKLGANAQKAIGITSVKAQKITNATTMFAQGAAIGTLYGGAYQLSEDAQLSAGRTLAEASIGGTANLAFGALFAGLGTKVTKATGAEATKVSREIAEAVEEAADKGIDPVELVSARMAKIVKESNATKITEYEVNKLYKYRLRQEFDAIENKTILGDFNWKVAGSLGGIGAAAGFLTAKDEKLQTALELGAGFAAVPIAFKGLQKITTKTKPINEQKAQRANEIYADELTANLQDHIAKLEMGVNRMQYALKTSVSDIKREAMVFAVQEPDKIINGSFTFKKFDKGILLRALNAREKGQDPTAILDELKDVTVVFNKNELKIIKDIIPKFHNDLLKNIKRKQSRFGAISNYIMQEWEIGPGKFAKARNIEQGEEVLQGRRILELFGLTGGLGGRAKKRLIPSYREGIEMGYIPRTNDIGEIDIADILARYGLGVGKALVEKDFVSFLKKRSFPGLAAPAVFDDFSKIPDSLAPDYIQVNHPILNKKTYDGDKLVDETLAYVHKDTLPYIRMVMDATDPPAIIRYAQNFNFFMKRFAVGASFFHAGSLGESVPFTFLRNPKDRKQGFTQIGQSLTGKKTDMLKWRDNPDDPSFIKWLENNYVATADRLKNSDYDDVFELLTANGLEINKPGDVGHDVFYKGFNDIERAVSKVPALGKVFNDLGVKPGRKVFKWFDKITWERAFTSFKLFTGTAKLNQLIADPANANVPLRILARDAASFANDAFGGQNFTRLANEIANPMFRRMAQEAFKPSARPYLQLAMFAPDWTISNIRILAKSFPAFNANERTRNLYMTYLINGAILYAVLGNAANYAFSGKSILENKDPTRIDLGNGEVLTFSKQYMEPFHWITDPQKTALKKTSSLTKTFAEVMTNKEYLTTGWSPQITKKDDSALDRALAIGGQVGEKFLPIWVSQAIEQYQKDGLSYDDALNVFLGQIGHPKYKGPRSTAFQTRGLVEDPMKVLF